MPQIYNITIPFFEQGKQSLLCCICAGIPARGTGGLFCPQIPCPFSSCILSVHHLLVLCPVEHEKHPHFSFISPAGLCRSLQVIEGRGCILCMAVFMVREISQRIPHNAHYAVFFGFLEGASTGPGMVGMVIRRCFCPVRTGCQN